MCASRPDYTRRTTGTALMFGRVKCRATGCVRGHALPEHSCSHRCPPAVSPSDIPYKRHSIARFTLTRALCSPLTGGTRCHSLSA